MNKLLVVTPWFPNHRHGWPAKFVSDSSIALARTGASVFVQVLRAWVPPGLSSFAPPEHRGDVAVEEFPEIREIRTARYPSFPGFHLPVVRNKLMDTFAAKAIEKAIGHFRPDAVLVHAETLVPSAVMACEKYRSPLVAVLHGENTNKSYISTGRQYGRFRSALSSVDRLVIVGEPLRGFAERLAGRHDHIRVVFNGVHPAEQLRAVPKLDCEPVRLITVANLHESKGIDLLILALGELAQRGVTHWSLNIVGAGDGMDGLKRLACEQRIEDFITFSGAIENSEVMRLLATADVFVLPSWRESFGVAYLEAMSAGLLAIGVEGQGPSQFIRHEETGYLVQPRDSKSLSQLLDRICSSGERAAWRRVAERGRDLVLKEFTWDSHAHKLREVMSEICERGQTL